MSERDKYLELMYEKLKSVKLDLNRIHSTKGSTEDKHLLYGELQAYVDAITTYENMKAKGEI
jgi:hypothetical protein